ncbi:hypothetical protein Plhal304r1_c022g0077181 [Plasmopara halstedii]
MWKGQKCPDIIIFSNRRGMFGDIQEVEACSLTLSKAGDSSETILHNAVKCLL